jgi:hypothetical protein
MGTPGPLLVFSRTVPVPYTFFRNRSEKGSTLQDILKDRSDPAADRGREDFQKLVAEANSGPKAKPKD